MNFRSVSTRLFIIFSIVFAFAFAGDDDAFYFSLSSDQIFYPGAAETSVAFSANGVGKQTVYMRAFRIPDPVEFFLAQKDPHSPSLRSLAPPNTFDMIGQGFQRVKRDARYAARDVMPADARRAIRDVADLNGTKAEKEKEKQEKGKPKDKSKTQPADRSQLAVDDLPKGAEGYEIVASWEHRLLPKKDDEDWHYESIPVPIKERGVYLIEARTRGKRAITALVISEYGMVVKQSNTELLGFIVNTRSGEKVSDFPLVIARGGEKIVEKETGGDGMLRTAIPPLPAREIGEDDEDAWRWEYRRRQILVVGEKDGNFVISDPYYYNYGSDGSSRIYLQTDRPVYRPAQSVYFRGILRRVNTDGTYASPSAGDTIDVTISNPQGDDVWKDSLVVSDLGTFNGEFKLTEEPPLGTYSISVRRRGDQPGAEQWFNFSVEEYKKPEYKVVVATDRQQYTRGDVITASVKADYFFGSPVANADVEYFIYRGHYRRPWWRGSEWAYLYDDGDDDFAMYRMEMVHSGKGTLNPDGTFQITYTTDPRVDGDYTYRIQANVVDNSRRSIAGAKSVQVTRGEFYVSTRTDRYVYKPGAGAKIDVEIATFEGDRPVATPFTVRVLRTWWDRTPLAGSPGEFEYKRRSEKIWTGNGATDASGKGSVAYTPERAGYFEVQVEARDSRGTEITESSYIFVADESYANWYREGSGDVQIIPDKQAYKPGETMSALIIMPAANIDALVTVEGATIYASQVERLSGTSAIVRIPIEERYAPAVYLSAASIVNDQMYSETQRVAVVPEGKVLSLEVTTDKQTYKPGEKGSVMIRALDERGTPVSNVDVAVGMVDEAIYSIRPDITPDIQRFFYGNRWNEVSTSSSLNFSFYGDAVRIDKDATDALYGAATGRSDGDRFASRGSRDRSHLAFGDVKGNMFIQPVTRKNFKDLMYWAPSVRTGADGRAKLSVEFPDNLTTWRISARGVTAGTAVGQATARVVARKDLMVRMETPRFLVQGDELLIATTIHNYLPGEKITKVELSGTNVTHNDRERTITIPANGETRIDWKVSAPRTGTATLTVKALTNEESDAMELTVPVIANAMKLATGASARFDDQTGSRTMNLILPEGAEAESGELYVSLSPSLAGSLIGALDSLIGYPYGCVEQTMSRFLPTVVIAQALQRLDIPFDAKKREELPKMVNKGLSRLYTMQHEDGGWGWWENDESDPFMTAYVVYGLTLARDAGFGVHNGRWDVGIEALRKIIAAGKHKDAKLDPTTEAYMLYVLSVANRHQPQRDLISRIGALSRLDINDYARALLALASHNFDQKADAAAQVARLEKNADRAADFAFWEIPGQRYYWQNDNVEATAFAVKALLAVKGETDLVDKGVQWLLGQKVGGAWHNTRQTAMVIYSLVDYLERTKELAADYRVVVKVNGQEVYARQVTRADIFKPEERIRLERAPIRKGGNNVTIEKSGAGRLYSSARLVYYATGPALRQSRAGIAVTREYYTLRKERRGDAIVYLKGAFRGTVKSGDEVFVKVTVAPDVPYEYFMLEDPLPAGCEVVTNTAGYTILGEPEYDENARKDRWGWHWWYADRSVRDEKVAFFARYLEPRTNVFTYVLRAQIPGRYSVMPAIGSLMYYPEVRGNSDPVALEVTP